MEFPQQNQLTSKHNQIIESERNMLSDAYQNSLVEVLTAHGIIKNQDETLTILQKNYDHVQTELQSHHDKNSSINYSSPVHYKTVQAVYADGRHSIVKNLLIPTVSICNKAACIPAREIINHILAMGINVMFF